MCLGFDRGLGDLMGKREKAPLGNQADYLGMLLTKDRVAKEASGLRILHIRLHFPLLTTGPSRTMWLSD